MAMMENLQNWLAMPLFSVGNYSLETIEIISAMAYFIGAMIVYRLIVRASTAASKRSRANEKDLYIVHRVLKYVIYGIGILLALSSLGVSFDRLLIVAGALGVGIGFGLQSIVNNFVCGIIILFEKSLRVGDFVELPNGLLGEVREINIRSTLLRTVDNADILVPNSDFINNQVNNWTLNDDVRRFSIRFSVAYGSDIALVRKAVLKAAENVPLTLHRDNIMPDVMLTELASSGVDFILSVWVEGEWVKRPGLVKSHYLTAIYNSLREHGLEIPFPQVDVHMR